MTTHAGFIRLGGAAAFRSIRAGEFYLDEKQINLLYCIDYWRRGRHCHHAGTPILFFGFLGLSRHLDLNRPLVVAALIAYGFGAVAVMCAAVLSGLVATPLTGQMLEADEATRQVLNGFLNYTGLLNQGFTKVFVVASSIAVIFWSVSLWRLRGSMQALAMMGCVIGAVSVAAFFAGHLRLNVHGFGLFLFGQSLWTITLGALLLRSGRSLISHS